MIPSHLKLNLIWTNNLNLWGLGFGGPTFLCLLERQGIDASYKQHNASLPMPVRIIKIANYELVKQPPKACSAFLILLGMLPPHISQPPPFLTKKAFIANLTYNLT